MAFHFWFLLLLAEHRTDCARNGTLSLLGLMGVAPGAFASCALVGSSPELLRGRMGEEIDAHELVMRFNNAPVGGFEELVGSRTTVRVVNTLSLLNVMLTTKGRDPSSWCPSYTVLLNTVNVNTSHVHKFVKQCGPHSPALVPVYRPLVKKTVPTIRALRPTGFHVLSGAVGIAIAETVCRGGIDLYGFSAARERVDALEAYAHYYDHPGCAGGDASRDGDPRQQRVLLAKYVEASEGCVRLRAPVARRDEPIGASIGSSTMRARRPPGLDRPSSAASACEPQAREIGPMTAGLYNLPNPAPSYLLRGHPIAHAYSRGRRGFRLGRAILFLQTVEYRDWCTTE
jgi:alpha-N-acetyl-neuraminate alpha-2,8-sialyltransferase (sialyltransferase 8B)/alpha-N-acetyl-neuraminate alpha-2,8-sialyltransferase (sialyltransferase 8D)